MGDSIPMFQQLSLKRYSTAGGIPAACLKEISTLKMLAHPNVVRVCGVERSGGGGGATLTVAFDLSADHLALEHLIADPARWRRLDPKRLMKQLLGALAHCHTYGVAHRCVNPSTIAVSPDGALKLAGFSHLHSVGSGPGQPISMQTREAYMSPEALYCALGPVLNLGADAAKGRAAPLYFSSDVWAAACVLLDVLCARASVEPTQPLRCTSPNAECTNISEAALLHQLTAVYAACGVSTSPVAAPWEHAGACVDTAQCAPAARLGPEGRQFLQAALQFNPVLRGTAASLLAVPYLCDQEAEDSMMSARAGGAELSPHTQRVSCQDRSSVQSICSGQQGSRVYSDRFLIGGKGTSNPSESVLDVENLLCASADTRNGGAAASSGSIRRSTSSSSSNSSGNSSNTPSSPIIGTPNVDNMLFCLPFNQIWPCFSSPTTY